ncbi:uncharacterized protein LOC143258391 isoform X2 [Tachypleus tridentatus]|uniref:uncharacterized protein LOC143258391 isoform X2 n=1 Tax=Tachypleus tridentatus TaxID=6853 RepID=UPI003FD52F64
MLSALFTSLLIMATWKRRCPCVSAVLFSIFGYLVLGGVSGNKTQTVDICRTFKWDDGYMKYQLKVALQQGLPFPILTVLEYFIEDFGWTPRFCLAGRFVASLLSISLVFSAVLLFLWYCSEAEDLHVGGSLSVSGVLIISSSVIYDVMMPKIPLTIHFQEGVLYFSYSWSFFVTFSVGFVSSALGILNMVAPRDIYRPKYYQNAFNAFPDGFLTHS